jgi:phage terminase large subunit
VLDGAIYANEIREATARNRITAVPYDKQFPVDVYFDLGWADSTAMWYTQKVGFEQRVLKSYANSQHPIQHYLDHMRQSGYVIGTVSLPHDAQAKQLGTGKSIEEIVKAAGFTVRVIPRLSVADGITAARTVFHLCYFDAEGCADGLHSLRRYRYDVNPDTGQYSKVPLHDEHSHYADGFRYLSIGISPGGAIKDREHNWRKKLARARGASAMAA